MTLLFLWVLPFPSHILSGLYLLNSMNLLVHFKSFVLLGYFLTIFFVIFSDNIFMDFTLTFLIYFFHLQHNKFACTLKFHLELCIFTWTFKINRKPNFATCHSHDIILYTVYTFCSISQKYFSFHIKYNSILLI